MPATPYQAKTNKRTWLIRVISNSAMLPANTPLTVYNEVGAWADVSTTPPGEARPSHGSVQTADYDAV